MKKIIVRYLFGIPETGEPINLNFSPIHQKKEIARGEEAHRQAAQFNEAFAHIYNQLKY